MFASCLIERERINPKKNFSLASVRPISTLVFGIPLSGTPNSPEPTPPDAPT
jgi:hypothetical protein